MDRILASSLDNWMILNNPNTVLTPPFVTFRATNPTDVRITIQDADNPEGYLKVIEGASGNVISDTSFNTDGVPVLSLLECLKLIPIFYDFNIQSADTIKAYIESSTRYSITVSGSGVYVGGSYMNHIATAPNKDVLMIRAAVLDNSEFISLGERDFISLEKYSAKGTVPFNVTAPFSRTCVRYPIQCTYAAYQVYNNTTGMLTCPYSSATIMPTTLSKFQNIDYGEYYYTQSGKTRFLTTNTSRRYSYGEKYGLSVIAVKPLTLKKDYYTSSGVFLESSTTVDYMEVNGIRTDFYDVLDLEHVEARNNHQVGYVDVFAMDGQDEATSPVRFNVIPRCGGNNEVFFINEIGGIDSFNFNGISSLRMAASDVSTYMSNPVGGYGDTKRIERQKAKRDEVLKTLRTGLVSAADAEWLNELVKSKFVYQWLGTSNPKYMEIIPEKMVVETDSRGGGVEVELQYHDGDNRVML